MGSRSLSPLISGTKYNLPLPKLSPESRLQRRLNWRTEFNFFKRKSDFSGKNLISQFPNNSLSPVYSLEEWLSDAWDPLNYGITYDINRSFFEQFKILNFSVPKPALGVSNSENCEYTNSSGYNKNCYLIASSSHNEHCFFGLHLQRSYHCFDCSFVFDCSFCYECIDCINCNELQYSWNCKDCSNSYFLHSCRNCQDCFGSVNLVNKKYVFFNQQLDKQTYLSRLNSLQLGSYSNLSKVKELFESHRLKYPHSHFIGESNEKVIGNNIHHSKNLWFCFDATHLQDCRYCIWLHKATDCMDCYSWGMPSELCYECVACGDHCTNCLFSASCIACNNVLYSSNLRNCSNCFGCVSLKRKEYCVFNKQYNKADYFELVSLIISRMIKNNEWGEFFPFGTSDSFYNYSIAQLYFPLDRQKAESIGANWCDELGAIPSETVKISDHIKDIQDDLTKKILTCCKSQKTYKLIAHELKFYHQYNIPIPRLSPEQRNSDRILRRLPRKLWKRKCDITGKEVYSAYSTERKEIICESQEFTKLLLG